MRSPLRSPLSPLLSYFKRSCVRAFTAEFRLCFCRCVLCFWVHSMSDPRAMSNVCAFCQVRHVKSVCAMLSGGKLSVCLDCAGRRIDSTAICEVCADEGLASSLGRGAPSCRPPSGALRALQ